MKVIIIGAAGFLGSKLANELLSRKALAINGGQNTEISKLILVDKFMPTVLSSDPCIEVIQGDLRDKKILSTIVEQNADVIFHLAAVVSGEAEKNFDLGMQVNLTSTLEFLECIRKQGSKPVLVFSSTCGVFGGDNKMIIRDDTAPTPQSSYGTQKTVAELLINDYSRREFLNGRILRLPTIVVRPGKPNAAASSFASSIIREPLEGRTITCPVRRETEMWILSPRKVIEHLIKGAEIAVEALGINRIVTLPGITVSLNDVCDALRNIAGEDVVNLISWNPDPFIEKIVSGWPMHFVTNRANKLGFEADKSIEEIIQNFIDEDMVKENLS